MSNRFNEFETILEAAKGDFEKFFEKENSAAGTRVRKALQELTVLAKEVRKEVTEIKTARKVAKG